MLLINSKKQNLYSIFITYNNHHTQLIRNYYSQLRLIYSKLNPAKGPKRALQYGGSVRACAVQTERACEAAAVTPVRW